MVHGKESAYYAYCFIHIKKNQLMHHCMLTFDRTQKTTVAIDIIIDIFLIKIVNKQHLLVEY
jgi:hypothetical protein